MTKSPDSINRPVKILLIIAGSLSVILGFIGIFVPVWPTTPFLLLAAACYIRSSERLYTWLISNRWFGDYIRKYREGQGIPVRIKILSLALLWLSIGFSVLVVIPWLFLKIILLIIAGLVTCHILRLKSCKE